MEYVIKNKNTKKFIAIDANSGGYPYEVDKAIQAKLWDNTKKANEYRDIFHNNDWELHTIATIVSVIPISWT